MSLPGQHSDGPVPEHLWPQPKRPEPRARPASEPARRFWGSVAAWPLVEVGTAEPQPYLCAHW